MTADLKRALQQFAHEAGFAAARVASPDAIGEAGSRLQRFVELDRHGDMHWMAGTLDRRRSPRALWPDVRSIIMLAAPYASEDDPLAVLGERARGAIAGYAQGRDYHDVMKPALKRVAAWLVARTGGDVKVFLDTAPVLEKPLAAAAGLGWQGKHTNLVSRELGSWFFLGAIFTTAEIDSDAAGEDHCGSCRRCLDICPTSAFPAPYQLDARRCVSYLTIEHKGTVDPELRPLIGNRIYGCDDCLAVCPWNKFAAMANGLALGGREDLRHPPLAELLELDDAAFRTRFRGTPMKRTGRDRFLRNVLIAAGNSRLPKLLEPVVARLADASPLVRAMAVWAAHRLAPADELMRLKARYYGAETDSGVLAEWQSEGTA